jgi:uncharacterized protein with HEPN domain
MPRELRKYLEDIHQCIAEVDLFTAGKTLEDYEQEVLLRRAVEREFTILAEAIKCINQISPDTHKRIDHVRAISDFRNIIVHQYHDVDDSYVWKMATGSLPLLKPQIDAWIAELDHL